MLHFAFGNFILIILCYFQCVILTEVDFDTQILVDDYCRLQNPPIPVSYICVIYVHSAYCPAVLLSVCIWAKPVLALLNTVSKENMSKGCILFWWLAIYSHFKHDNAGIALRFVFQLVDMMRQTAIYEPHLSGKSSWGRCDMKFIWVFLALVSKLCWIFIERML